MNTRLQAILLLVVLVGHLVRPLMPYIDYAINKDYIAANLCENKNKPGSCCAGKCYVAKEVARQSDDSNAEKKPDTRKWQTEKDLKEYVKGSHSLDIPQPKPQELPVWAELLRDEHEPGSHFVPPKYC